MTILIENSHADGVCFDDLQGLTADQRKAFIGRGLVFGTEFKANDRRYAGNIIANSATEAAKIAISRGLGEIILGQLEEEGAL